MRKSVSWSCMVFLAILILSFGSVCYAQDSRGEVNDTFEQENLKQQCLGGNHRRNQFRNRASSAVDRISETTRRFERAVRISRVFSCTACRPREIPCYGGQGL